MNLRNCEKRKCFENRSFLLTADLTPSQRSSFSLTVMLLPPRVSPQLQKSVGAGPFFCSYKKNFELVFLKRVKIVFIPIPQAKERHRSLLRVIIGVNTPFDDCFHIVCNSKIFSLTSSPCRLFVTHD